METTAIKTTFPKYTAYKDSGVEWLGEIPEGWEVKRLASIGKFSKGGGFSKSDLTETGFSAILYGDIYTKYEFKIKIPVRFISPQTAKKSIEIKKGDLLFTGSGETKEDIGKCVVLDFEGEVYAGGDVIVFKQYLNDNSFLSYYLNSQIVKDEKAKTAKGEIIVHTYGSKLKEIYVCLPSFYEQTAIAAFLDDKTAKIDRVIAQKQQMIDLLKERKQIIIQNAVTGKCSMVNGEWLITPKDKMKHSGVEWIGEIPEGWEVSKLKYNINIKGGFAFNSGSFRDEGIQVIKIANTYMNRLALEREPSFLDLSYLNTHKNWIVSTGDILMSLTGTMGKTDYGFAILIETDDKYLLNQRVAKISIKSKKLNSSYLILMLRSDLYLNQLYCLPSGTKQANLSNDNVINILMPTPTIEEQIAIVAHIETQSAKIDQAISLQQTQIEKLKEYKATLIDSAVTGKIKVG